MNEITGGLIAEALFRLMIVDYCGISNLFIDQVDQTQVAAAVQIVLDHVETEATLLNNAAPAYDKIFIGGFSQGSLLSLATLFGQYNRFNTPFAGYIGLNGLVPVQPTSTKCTAHPLSMVPTAQGGQASLI